jgi:hypothetical protein
MAETYRGVVENGIVVLPKQAKIRDGTPVLVTPQIDSENEWLTVTQAARRFEASAALVRQWVKSAKVRVHPHDPKLVSAGDVEDALEQHELLGLTMRVVEQEE